MGASLVAQLVKNLPAIQETLIRFLSWKDPLEKGMVTHSSVPDWESHRQRSLGNVKQPQKRRDDLQNSDRLTATREAGRLWSQISPQTLKDSNRKPGLLYTTGKTVTQEKRYVLAWMRSWLELSLASPSREKKKKEYPQEQKLRMLSTCRSSLQEYYRKRENYTREIHQQRNWHISG